MLSVNRLDGKKNDVSNFGNEKKRKEKIWTKLKSGLYGWKTVTGNCKPTSSNSSSNNKNTQSKSQQSPKPKSRKSANKSLSNWLITTRGSGAEGGKNDGVHASETYCSKENKHTENNQILAGKLNTSEPLVKGQCPEDRELEGTDRV